MVILVERYITWQTLFQYTGLMLHKFLVVPMKSRGRRRRSPMKPSASLGRTAVCPESQSPRVVGAAELWKNWSEISPQKHNLLHSRNRIADTYISNNLCVHFVLCREALGLYVACDICVYVYGEITDSEMSPVGLVFHSSWSIAEVASCTVVMSQTSAAN